MDAFIKEACVENLAQAIKAMENGADRVELCHRLNVGGITPSRDLIKATIAGGIPVSVMIRPRGGNFQYTEEEFKEMIDSINFCKEAGAKGVVFGIQQPDKNLNYALIEKLAKNASPLNVIIHKAIDETPDPVKTVRNLMKIKGVTGVLTSGGLNSTAFDGRKTLVEMLELAGDKFEIIPAGRITDKNVHELHEILGAKSYHGKEIVGRLWRADIAEKTSYERSFRRIKISSK